LRSTDGNGAWDLQSLRTLDEAVPLLKSQDNFVLGLPVSAVLSQRLHLPSADPAEFAEMVRLQIEKALPFSPEEVTSDFEVIEQNAEGSVVSAVAIRNEQLAELAGPLLERGYIPRQVTVYASQRATTYAPEGNALFIYPEGESLVSAVTENGKVSLTRTMGDGGLEQLQAELPQLALSAELQGISSAFPNVLIDESCYDLRDTVQGILSTPPEMVGVERPPASVKLNLLPESWRQRRVHLERITEWRKRLAWVGGIYGGIFLLLLAMLGITRFRISQFDKAIARDEPQIEFVRGTEANWKALAPAIDSRYYPVETLFHLFESLPSKQVRITSYNQSARQLSVDGEADTAQLAYDLAEKVKKNPGLQIFQFKMGDPRILANGHAQFRLEGRPR